MSAENAGVYAAGAGVVRFAATVAGRGVVVVGHPDGTRTTYEPVGAVVPVGAAVAAGQLIGNLSPGGGHCLPRVCLHWGRLRGEVYLDPLALLGRSGPPRLLPVWAAVGSPTRAGAAGGSPTRAGAAAGPPSRPVGASVAAVAGTASTRAPGAQTRPPALARPADRPRWSLVASTSSATRLMLLVAVLLVLMLLVGARGRETGHSRAGSASASRR